MEPRTAEQVRGPAARHDVFRRGIFPRGKEGGGAVGDREKITTSFPIKGSFPQFFVLQYDMTFFKAMARACKHGLNELGR